MSMYVATDGARTHNLFAKNSASLPLARALEHYRKDLAISEKALGPGHPDTLITVFNMGSLATQSGDKAAAKSLFARAAKGFAKSLGPAHPQTLQAQQYLGRCG